MSTQLSPVYQKLVEILRSYSMGISWSRLSILENRYQEKCKGSLDYESLGVSNIQELLVNMGNMRMVVFFDERESKEKYVMAASVVKFRRDTVLKPEVEELLIMHGEILFSSFEDLYKDFFKENLNYHFFGLSGLEDLCENLNDILVVREVNRSGAKVKVIEAVVVDERKRKR